MSTNYMNPPESQRMKPQQDDTIDLRKLFFRIRYKWHYLIISLIVSFMVAFLYNTFTIPTYRVSATLLIDEERKAGLMGTSRLGEGYGVSMGEKNLDNQISVLSSKTLIGKTLDELPFYIGYYNSGLVNNVALYPNNPIKIVPVTADSLPRDIEFIFKYLDNNRFSLDAEIKDFGELNIEASFGEIIKTPGGRFHIELSSDIGSLNYLEKKIKFRFHSREKLVGSYRKRMKVEQVSKTGTIVTVSLEGTNKTMDVEFLSKLTEIFLNNSLDKKNLEAIRTIEFIDDQLIGISDSLVITENKLQQFRSRNKVMDLSAQGQLIINQAMSLENEKARLEIEANYYDYLAEYLAKDNIGQAPIAPATMGITDPGLTKLVADLADLQGQYYSKSLGEKNPLQSQLAQRVINTKEALRETLNGVRRANDMSITEISEQIRTVNAQASVLPETERQLLGIERKYKLNDELYTFLLEKRAAAQIQKASNMPDNEIIDPSEADDKPVKPKKQIIILLAIIAGISIPLFWIYITDNFNNKVREDEDLTTITDIPISGHIPHSLMKQNTVLLDDPNSPTAEAFRSLRSRMQFFTKESKTPVILITSSMPGEGKTFAAINLASGYSLIGKKTVLIGFDLRKPKIYLDYGISNDTGVSTWLIGKDSLNDIIQETRYENLSVISAGPVPPNPSELIALEKTEELLKLLKERYEYIIIDSSPIGAVSDTYHLVRLADTCIMIVRQNFTLKDLIRNTMKELKVIDIKSLSLVINDLGSEFKGIGYGGRDGYNYFKEKSKK